MILVLWSSVLGFITYFASYFLLDVLAIPMSSIQLTVYVQVNLGDFYCVSLVYMPVLCQYHAVLIMFAL